MKKNKCIKIAGSSATRLSFDEWLKRKKTNGKILKKVVDKDAKSNNLSDGR